MSQEGHCKFEQQNLNVWHSFVLMFFSKVRGSSVVEGFNLSRIFVNGVS